MSYTRLTNISCQTITLRVGLHPCHYIKALSVVGVANLLVMCVGCGDAVEKEQSPQIIAREMTFNIFLFVHYTAAESFLVSLTLEDLLFN